MSIDKNRKRYILIHMNTDKKYNFTSELNSIGLSKDESIVYEFLLQNGRSTVGNIKKNIHDVSRPMIYVILEKLVEKKLVEKKELDGKVTLFIAQHPLTLNALVEEKEFELNRSKAGLQSAIGKLTSVYNINNGTPGLEYFEGKQAVDEILNDSLTSSEVIYQYLDVEAQEKFLHEENIEYLKSRKKSKIEKKIIALDTELTRKAFLEDQKNGIDISNVRLIKNGEKQLGVSVMIYDNKISYLTFNEKQEVVGIIIHNKEIYKMNKFLFEAQFETAKSIHN